MPTDLVEVFIAAYPNDPYVAETVACFPGYRVTVDDSTGYHPTAHPAAVKWNTAIENCKSKYLALPHSDDLYSEDFLPTMVTALEAHPEAVAALCYDRSVDKLGRPVGKATVSPFPDQEVFDFETVVRGLFKHGNFLRCPSLVINREVLGNLRFDMTGRFDRAVDMGFFVTILHHHPILLVNQQLYQYREHGGQDSEAVRQGATSGHWQAMQYAEELRPGTLGWEYWIVLNKSLSEDSQRDEGRRTMQKAQKATSCRFIVAHEPPDAAGTGRVAAYRARKYNDDESDRITYYVYPPRYLEGGEWKFVPNVQEGYERGCAVIKCPPHLFAATVKRHKPVELEFHHTLLWGDDVLRVDTTAEKRLYLHDRWMWSVHPHADEEFRDTRKYLDGIKVFGNSEWTCAEAKKKLGIEVFPFDPFVPVPTDKTTLSWGLKVGYFGGFHPTKGIHVLLSAARKMPNVLFVLFSDPPPEAMNGRRIYGHDNIVVLGGYRHGDMQLLSGLVDCCVVPSVFESYGLVKRELEYIGVPVIATKTGGMDGTIPPDDVHALVAAIETFRVNHQALALL